jgi:predicted transcriptional regulator YheO
MPDRHIKPFIPFVDAIAATLGNNCEVVLHDFSKPHRSIVKIANGHITGRSIGGPATDLILSFLENKGHKTESLIGYRTRTKKGVELKSTTVFIRNARNKIAGAFCINIDITPYTSAKNVLEELSSFPEKDNREEEEKPSEKFESSVDNLINELIDQSIKKTRKPVAHMRKEDKLLVIRDLRENGLFLIKGSTKRVSEELGVSLPTIYKYLEEIQGTSK